MKTSDPVTIATRSGLMIAILSMSRIMMDIAVLGHAAARPSNDTRYE
jgi:hypothetical protein